MTEQYKSLTLAQETKARVQAWEQFRKEAAAARPQPEITTEQLLADKGGTIRKLLIVMASSTPALVLIVALSTMLIMADKTLGIFSMTHLVLPPAVVAIGAVVFLEVGILFTSFRAEWRKYSSGKAERPLSLRQLLYWISWRIGLKPPPDDYESNHAASMSYILLAMSMISTFAATSLAQESVLVTSGDQVINTLEIRNVLKLFSIALGVLAPLGLHFAGQQLAEIATSLMARELQKEREVLLHQWEIWVNQEWERFGEQRVTYALHLAYIQKNKLSVDSPSPYRNGGVERPFLATNSSNNSLFLSDKPSPVNSSN